MARGLDAHGGGRSSIMKHAENRIEAGTYPGVKQCDKASWCRWGLFRDTAGQLADRQAPTIDALMAQGGTPAGESKPDKLSAINAYADRMGVTDPAARNALIASMSSLSLDYCNQRLDAADRYKQEFERRYAEAGLNPQEIEAEWKRQAAIADSPVNKMVNGQSKASEISAAMLDLRLQPQSEIQANANQGRAAHAAEVLSNEKAQPIKELATAYARDVLGMTDPAQINAYAEASVKAEVRGNGSDQAKWDAQTDIWKDSVEDGRALRESFRRGQIAAGRTPEQADSAWRQFAAREDLANCPASKVKRLCEEQTKRATELEQLHADFIAEQAAQGIPPAQHEANWQKFVRDTHCDDPRRCDNAKVTEMAADHHNRVEDLRKLREAVTTRMQAEGVPADQLQNRVNEEVTRLSQPVPTDHAAYLREHARLDGTRANPTATPPVAEVPGVIQQQQQLAAQRQQQNELVNRYAQAAGLNDQQKQALQTRLNNITDPTEKAAAYAALPDQTRAVQELRETANRVAASRGANPAQAEALWRQELQNNPDLVDGRRPAANMDARKTELQGRIPAGAPGLDPYSTTPPAAGTPGAPGAGAPGAAATAPNAREDTILRQAKDAAGRAAAPSDQPAPPTREELLAEQRQLQQQLRQAGRGGNPGGMNPLGFGANPLAATPHLAGMMPGGAPAGGGQMTPAEIRERLNEINTELRRTPATATPSGPPFTGNVVAMGRTENGQAVVLTTDDQGRTRAYAYDERNQKIGAAITRDQVITVTAVDGSTENLNLMRGNRLQLTVGEVSGPAAPAAPAGVGGPGGPGGGTPPGR
jgi:hypothetical protein